MQSSNDNRHSSIVIDSVAASSPSNLLLSLTDSLVGFALFFYEKRRNNHDLGGRIS